MDEMRKQAKMVRTILEMLDALAGVALLGGIFALLAWGLPDQRSAEADLEEATWAETPAARK